MSNQRRTILINPGFQIRFLAFIASALVLSLTAIYFGNTLFFEQMMTEGQSRGLMADDPYFELIEAQKIMLARYYIVVSTVVFTVFVFFGLILSHRVAGPLHQINKVMQLLGQAEGRGVRVKFREGDFFGELEEVINDAIEEFEKNSEPSQ